MWNLAACMQIRLLHIFQLLYMCKQWIVSWFLVSLLVFNVAAVMQSKFKRDQILYFHNWSLSSDLHFNNKLGRTCCSLGVSFVVKKKKIQPLIGKNLSHWSFYCFASQKLDFVVLRYLNVFWVICFVTAWQVRLLQSTYFKILGLETTFWLQFWNRKVSCIGCKCSKVLSSIKVLKFENISLHFQ